MARDLVRDATGGVLNSDHFRADTPAVTDYDFTVEGWVNLRDLTTAQQLWWCGDKDDSAHYMGVLYIPSGIAGAPNDCIAANARLGNQTFAFSSAGPSEDTWAHFAATFTSQTARAAFLNGANKGTDTSDNGGNSPSSFDRTALGVSPDSVPDSPFDGLLAEVRVWDGVLSDADIAALAAGDDPDTISTASVIHTWGLCEGETGNAIDATGSLDLTEFSVNGTAIGDAAHPSGLEGSVCGGAATALAGTGRGTHARGYATELGFTSGDVTPDPFVTVQFRSFL